MIRIGLLGSQSRHAEYFGTLFNTENLFDGFRATTLWGGDAPERISDVSRVLGIDEIADDPSELIDAVDAVLIILRNGNEHMKYAVEALNKGKPVFVDKPFAVKIEDARTIIDTANKTGTPLFGGSTLRHLPGVKDIKRRICNGGVSHVSIRYSADPTSPFGGYYFYGSHLAEISTALCGRNFAGVKAVKRENEVCSLVEYPHLLAMLHSAPDVKGLHISIFGEGAEHFVIDENSCYRNGMELFVNMLKTGIPTMDYEDFIRPVELLDSIVRLL